MIPSFPLDRSQNAPIYRQLYQRFREAIADGRLRPGDRVPAVRALAAQLNLARGTVEAAYQLLIGEGYLIARGPPGRSSARSWRRFRRPSFMRRLLRRRTCPIIAGRCRSRCRWACPHSMPFRANSGPGWQAVNCARLALRVWCTRTRAAMHPCARPLPATWGFPEGLPAARAGVRVRGLSRLPGPDQPHADASR